MFKWQLYVSSFTPVLEEEEKKNSERKREEEKKRFFGIKSGVWLVLKGCHGRKLMAISPGGEEAGGRVGK